MGEARQGHGYRGVKVLSGRRSALRLGRRSLGSRGSTGAAARDGLHSGRSHFATVLGLVVIVVALSMLASLGPESLDRVVIVMLINLILVVGTYTFVGMSGVFSFGHIGFAACGGYTAAILVIPPEKKPVLFPDMFGSLQSIHVSSLPAVLVGGAVAAIAAGVLAVPLMRLTGLAAGISTFALLVIVSVVAKNWTAVTNGAHGLSGIPVSTGISHVLAFAVVCICVVYAFQISRLGLRLRASREDEIAARGSGVHVERERGIAFCLSAFVVGVGGGLYALLLGTIQPDLYFLSLTFLTLAMLVIGGTRSLSGAVVGTLALSIVAEGLRQLEKGFSVEGTTIKAPLGLREVGIGLIMLAILIWKPGGLIGSHELTFRRRSGVRGEPRNLGLGTTDRRAHEDSPASADPGWRGERS